MVSSAQWGDVFSLLIERRVLPDVRGGIFRQDEHGVSVEWGSETSGSLQRKI